MAPIQVDGLIPEPAGGAQNDHAATTKAVKAALIAQLDRLSRVPTADLLSARYERFRSIGVVIEPSAEQAMPKPEPWWRRIVKGLQ